MKSRTSWRESLVQLFEVGDELLRLRGGVGRRGLFDVRGLGGRLLEEVAHRQLEDLEDPEERVEADLVLAVLHPREVRLRHADPTGEVGLGQAAALPYLTDLLPDHDNLRTAHGGTHRHVLEAKIRLSRVPVK